ncbi:2-oxoacid:acceptor oxidoreductase family protein [Thermopetrobacter sp. TC1]|uniref:2-oxoacid:acceptor oxidoreductase family protein n=1 Tax=Thermopetrobacter sp. TC1 TaxID=1495045 RepID=UPI000571E5D0|nr:2-oxoacid:acceptor oxidoreductase family protein [Thermopetrobacter sp. TC1]
MTETTVNETASAGASGEKTVAERPTNVLIVGVGGQGVIMVSKVLATLAQAAGNQVKQSEVHGMAKRGGAVFSHVRFGRKVFSPTIPRGEADVLLALEWAEGLRWLPYLNRARGVFIADTQRIVPPFACRNRADGAPLGYSRETPKDILAKVRTGYALNATGIAESLGNRRAANTVLLGVLSTALDFAEKDWLKVIESFVPPKTVEVNRAAFLKGREWAERHADVGLDEDVDFSLPSPPAVEPKRPQVFIERAWCKSCDICVKMCPERCLELDEKNIARMKAPERCTGCRLCEYLCPDFAIRVLRLPAGDSQQEVRP